MAHEVTHTIEIIAEHHSMERTLTLNGDYVFTNSTPIHGMTGKQNEIFQSFLRAVERLNFEWGTIEKIEINLI